MYGILDNVVAILYCNFLMYAVLHSSDTVNTWFSYSCAFQTKRVGAFGNRDV